jgi:hypothetical protein
MMGTAMKGGEEMIKLEETEVVGWRPAIRGMRNPMNSWEKSDSKFGAGYKHGVLIGPNDLDLMVRLRNAGTDHRKFMRMLTVYADITAPLYWWKEFDTYKVGTVANSCSTMHKIHAKRFTMADFSCEKLEDIFLHGLRDTVDLLNKARDGYLYAKKEEKSLVPAKDYWWQMIQLLPTSYNQKRTVMLNYEVLANMYHSRKNHKLDEWHTLCDWISTLPYAKELIIGCHTTK